MDTPYLIWRRALLELDTGAFFSTVVTLGKHTRAYAPIVNLSMAGLATALNGQSSNSDPTAFNNDLTITTRLGTTTYHFVGRAAGDGGDGTSGGTGDGQTVYFLITDSGGGNWTPTTEPDVLGSNFNGVMNTTNVHTTFDGSDTLALIGNDVGAMTGSNVLNTACSNAAWNSIAASSTGTDEQNPGKSAQQVTNTFGRHALILGARILTGATAFADAKIEIRYANANGGNVAPCLVTTSVPGSNVELSEGAGIVHNGTSGFAYRASCGHDVGLNDNLQEVWVMTTDGNGTPVDETVGDDIQVQIIGAYFE